MKKTSNMEQKQTREELIRQCRYYKGESDCPAKTPFSFWNYERKWVELSLDESDMLNQLVDEYVAYGLRDFSQLDNTPLSLCALLFNRFSRWKGCYIDEFREWYNREYLKNESQKV